MFCSLPPVARSSCCRTLDITNHGQKNNVIELWEDCGAGGEHVCGGGTRKVPIWCWARLMVVPVGLYDQESIALGILRSRRKCNPWTLKEGILVWREKVER